MRITILATFAAAAIAAAAALPTLAAPRAQTVRVTETDYRIVLAGKPRPGLVTFLVRNAGEKEHDFRIRGGGVTTRTPMIAPGRTARVAIRLKRGVRYQVWCAPHAGKGMRAAFVAR